MLNTFIWQLFIFNRSLPKFDQRALCILYQKAFVASKNPLQLTCSLFCIGNKTGARRTF